MVAQVLELAHLVQDDGVPEMQVRGRRIEPGLHAQRLAPGEFALQVFREDELVGAAADHLQIVRLSH